MKVQVLYFEGCPNHEAAVKLAKAAVSDLGLCASVEDVEVKGPDDAERLRFLGSPTILVDGLDIEPGARGRTDFGFCCRTYDGKGTPPQSLIEDALRAAGSSGAGTCCPPVAPSEWLESSVAGRSERWATLGSVGSAVVASACCWLPLLLLTFGISAAGVSAAFETTRPFFLLGAAGFLGMGFYLNSFRKVSSGPGRACAVPNPTLNRLNRAMLWVAAVVVMAAAFFPRYVGFLAGTTQAAAAQGTGQGSLTLRVEGMTCEACSAHIQRALAKVRGVKRASVRFAEGEALVAFDASSPPDKRALVEAVERAGYKATLDADGGKES